jgi:hypothetical protein
VNRIEASHYEENHSGQRNAAGLGLFDLALSLDVIYPYDQARPTETSFADFYFFERNG